MKKKNFKKRVLKIIDKCDIILEVVDARFPDLTRNKTLEKIIKSKGKDLLIVINKCDILNKDQLEKWKKEFEKEYPCVYISAKKRLGTKILRAKLREMARKYNKDKVIVGVIGFPNVGKSSIINILKGRKVCPVSAIAGYTKGEQLVKISNKLYLYDSPGIYLEKIPDEILYIVGAKNPEHAPDIEYLATKILEYMRDNFYDIFDKYFNSIDLEFIARKYNFYMSGGRPDTKRAAQFVLKKWINWDFK
jgi:ribosome biogenesis GTPase A